MNKVATHAALLTPQSYTHKRRPISAMSSSNKILQHNLNSHILHRPSIAKALHIFCMQSRQTISAMLSIATIHCSNPQHNLLSMHIKTHYTSTTTHPTTKKHKAYLCKQWQNGTSCRDGVKVLWCHSNLVWLVFEASIPTCTCFPSENFCDVLNYS